MNNQFDNCLNIDIFGPWKEHEFVKGSYCDCGEPWNRPMIACDDCDKWYHEDCVNLVLEDIDDLDSYEWSCAHCKHENDNSQNDNS